MKYYRLILIILTMSVLLSSCSDNAANKTTVTQTAKKTSASSSYYKNTEKDIYDINFRGTSFIFAVPPDEKNDIYADENGGNAIDRAVAKRNELLYDYYNCRIETVNIVPSALAAEIASNKNGIDFVNYTYSDAYRCIERFYDLRELDKEVFMQTLSEDGKLYVGNFSRSINESRSIILFNKNVKASVPAIDKMDFYNIVGNNSWTLDKFLGIIKLVSESSDACAFATSEEDIAKLYLGSGQSFASIPSLEGRDLKASRKVSSVLSEIYSCEGTLLTQKSEAQKMMKESETLFIIDSIGSLSDYISEKLLYGVLPLPVHDNYYKYRKNFIDKDSLFLFALKTERDIGTVADFLVLFEKYSMETIGSCFYEYYGYSCASDGESAATIYRALEYETFDAVYALGTADTERKYAEYILSGKKDFDAMFENIAKDISQNLPNR